MKSLKSYIAVYPRAQSIEVRVSCRNYKKDGLHFAECPELELLDQGDSKKEAIDNLQRMISITLISAIETGVLDEMLINLGFKRVKAPIPSIEIYDNPKAESYNDLIPIEFHQSLLPGLLKKSSVSV